MHFFSRRSKLSRLCLLPLFLPAFITTVRVRAEVRTLASSWMGTSVQGARSRTREVPVCLHPDEQEHEPQDLGRKKNQGVSLPCLSHKDPVLRVANPQPTRRNQDIQPINTRGGTHSKIAAGILSPSCYFFHLVALPPSKQIGRVRKQAIFHHEASFLFSRSSQ